MHPVTWRVVGLDLTIRIMPRIISGLTECPKGQLAKELPKILVVSVANTIQFSSPKINCHLSQLSSTQKIILYMDRLLNSRSAKEPRLTPRNILGDFENILALFASLAVHKNNTQEEDYRNQIPHFLLTIG